MIFWFFGKNFYKYIKYKKDADFFISTHLFCYFCKSVTVSLSPDTEKEIR